MNRRWGKFIDLAIQRWPIRIVDFSIFIGLISLLILFSLGKCNVALINISLWILLISDLANYIQYT